MISQNCCGAERIFDSKKAKKQKKTYLKKGPRGSTRTLIRLLNEYNMEGKSLLDIGGGVGAIQWHFLEKGGITTTGIDASPAYINIAREIAEEKKVMDKTTFINSDVTETCNNVSPHDFVTLDKVVCCYPDYRALLNTACDNSREILALTMPLSGTIPKVISWLGNSWFSLNKVPFRTHVHPRKMVDNFIRNKGFRLVHEKLSFPWYLMVYENEHRTILD